MPPAAAINWAASASSTCSTHTTSESAHAAHPSRAAAVEFKCPALLFGHCATLRCVVLHDDCINVGLAEQQRRCDAVVAVHHVVPAAKLVELDRRQTLTGCHCGSNALQSRVVVASAGSRTSAPCRVREAQQRVMLTVIAPHDGLHAPEHVQ